MSYTAAKSRPTYTFDANLEFKDAGLIAASAAAQVDAAAKVVDLGKGFVHGDMVIDVTAIEVASGDESYKIAVELSNNSDFSTGTEFEKCALVLGDATIHGGDTDSTVGRYILPFNNRAADETIYQYARIYVTVAGTVATGINFTAFAAIAQ